MLNIVPAAWGKLVNSVWVCLEKLVDERPQNGAYALTGTFTAVYNHRFMPVLTPLFPRFYPQAKSTDSSLLRSQFSPLSTAPITTTTNLKKEER